MNKTLRFCFAVITVAFMLPFGVLELSIATEEWPLFWQVRTYLINHSGMVSMILMSLCVILSVKHWPVERWLGGLDKQYRLHKYLGISAVFTAMFHWLVFLSDDFAMEMGYVPMKAEGETFPFWTLFDALGDPAQLIGEYGFYLSAAFVVIAWIKKFKHNLFQMTHKVFPYLYLLLVLHMMIFFEASLWLTLSGMVLFVVSTLATIGCLITILGFNGKKKRHTATIESMTPIANGIEVILKADNPQQFVYQSGQFAFIDFGDKERAHPFSLASANGVDANVRLLIKANGDYTNRLKDNLTVGQKAEIEGPYGRFNFDDRAAQQIWFAAGIGIAPFLSAIERVSKDKAITLFYSYREKDEALLNELKEKANQAGIKLHLRNTALEPRFEHHEVVDAIEDAKQCSVWFCGPAKLGQALERECKQQGVPSKAFHRELFEFR